MASPLANSNSIPPSAIFEHRPHELAFGRPVQSVEQASKQLPSPDRVRVYPLPADQEKCEDIFVRACQAGNEAEVQHLLTAAPRLTACELYDELLYSSARTGEGGMLDLLLEFKKNNTDEYMLLLANAAERATLAGEVHILRGLLEKGLSVRGHRTRLLHTAILRSHKEIAELLVQAGADIEAEMELLWINTPLTRAVLNDDLFYTQWLLAQGADPNRRPGNTGRPPLAWACYRGDLAKVKILLEAGALIDRGEYEGLTPLALAVKNGHENVVHHLLRSGADVNAACEPCQAPLYRAVENRKIELASILLQAGAAADLRCEQKVLETPLMVAVQDENILMAELLVDHGADMHRRGPAGLSALRLSDQAGLWYQRISSMLREKAAQQAARAGGEPQPVEP